AVREHVLPAARDLLELELPPDRAGDGLEDLQALAQDLGPDAVSGKRDDVVAVLHLLALETIAQRLDEAALLEDLLHELGEGRRRELLSRRREVDGACR